MFFTNVFDEKERFVGLKVENIRYDPIQDENGRCVGFNPVIVNGQFDSHTFSYLERASWKKPFADFNPQIEF